MFEVVLEMAMARQVDSESALELVEMKRAERDAILLNELATQLDPEEG